MTIECTVERVFFGSGYFSEFSNKNPKITIFRNFSKKLSIDWLFVLQWMQSPLLDTLVMCPCVVTHWHVLIVLFCKHTSCGNWLLILDWINIHVLKELAWVVYWSVKTKFDWALEVVKSYFNELFGDLFHLPQWFSWFFYVNLCRFKT